MGDRGKKRKRGKYINWKLKKLFRWNKKNFHIFQGPLFHEKRAGDTVLPKKPKGPDPQKNYWGEFHESEFYLFTSIYWALTYYNVWKKSLDPKI